MKKIVDNTYTTQDGVKITLHVFSYQAYQMGVATIKKEYRDRGEPIEPPTFTVALDGGVTREYTHDAKSILQAPPGTPPDQVSAIVEKQKQAWEDHLKAKERLIAETNALYADYFFEDALCDIRLPDDNSSWEDRQRRRHVVIPDDPEAKRRHWINTELLKSPQDMVGLTAKVMSLVGGEDEEVVMDMVDGFLNTLRSKQRSAGGATLGAGGGAGQMDIQPSIPATPYGEGVGTPFPNQLP